MPVWFSRQSRRSLAAARDVVVLYVSALAVADHALAQQFDGARMDEPLPGEPLEPMTLRTPDGEKLWNGRLAGVGSFQMHGIGVQIDFDSGESVDFDFNSDWRPMFDAWRLRGFAQSIGIPPPTDEVFDSACEVLVGEGVLERRTDEFPGWYSVNPQ